jgi:uncharacterized lipoprotein YmbA
MRLYWVCIATTLVGCGSVRVPATKYYKLDMPAAQAPVGPSTRAALRIEPFRAAAWLRQDRIVYRPSPVEVGYYEYHQWAEPPSASITKALAEQLTKRRVFQSVDISDAGEKTNYILRGTVDRLQEVDYMGDVRVQVSISAELEDAARQQVIWTSAASSEFSVAKSDVQAVVTAMSHASQQSIARLMTDMAKFLQVNRLAAGDPPR